MEHFILSCVCTLGMRRGRKEKKKEKRERRYSTMFTLGLGRGGQTERKGENKDTRGGKENMVTAS